jgi:hypothetical protein
VDPKPTQISEQLCDVRLLSAFGIRILDAQHQKAAVVTGQQQIK